MDDYTEQDIRDVAFKQQINSIKAQAYALGIDATVEAAIRWYYEQGDVPFNMAEEVDRYHRGEGLNQQFVLVTSDRRVTNDYRSEEIWKEQNSITGPVNVCPAGYVATNQMWVFMALRPRG